MSAPQQREAAQHLVETGGCSQRQACRIVGLWRSTANYKASWLLPGASGTAPQWAQGQPQTGLSFVEAREVERASAQKAQASAAEQGSVPSRLDSHGTQYHVVSGRVQENTLTGGRLRILCVTDEFTRESLAIEVGRSFHSERLCQMLEEVIKKRAVPGALRMDNGPEFVALSLRGLCHRRGINPAYILPGKSWKNGFAESFHSRLRDEFLDGEVLHSVCHAQVRPDSWRRDWNQERLHSRLGYLTPNDFAAQWTDNLANSEKTQAPSGP